MPVIGITLGDAAGIGPEIVAKAAAEMDFTRIGHPVIIGNEGVFRRGMEIAGLDCKYSVAANITEAREMPGLVLMDTKMITASAVQPGQKSVVCGKESAENMRMAVQYCKQGLLDGICFAPNNKAAMKEAGFSFNGAVDLLAGFFEYSGYCGELGVLDKHWTARVTSHVPLKEVSARLSVSSIMDSIRLLYNAQKLAGFDPPRIAIAGFNPHSGEGGTCGTEEIDVISPAVSLAQKEGIAVEGPFSADTLFIRLFSGDFDGVVTMSHDQGQIAMKLKGFDDGTTVMAGLPKPVTTSSHGTAFNIAGKGVAKSGAWISAYKMVCRMAKTNMEC